MQSKTTITSKTFDAKNVCRTCMGPLSTQFIDIFNDSRKFNEIYRKITDLPIKENDSYPKNICKKCEKLLLELQNFIEMCKKTFNNLTKQIEKDEELRKQENQVKFLCSSCGRSFKSGKLLNRHMAIHAEIKEFKCFCGKEYTSRYSYNHHKSTHKKALELDKDIYPTGKNHLCQKCGKSFSSINSYRFHQSMHNNKGPYECDICKKVFTRSSTLLEHKNAHEGIKHTCRYCNGKYASKASLRTHLFTHGLKEKKHKCEICQSSFNRPSLLKSHLKTHEAAKDTGGELFQCNHCQSAFSKKAGLKNHLYKHVQKPFPCQICSASFVSQEGLEKHAKIIHDPSSLDENEIILENEVNYIYEDAQIILLKEGINLIIDENQQIIQFDNINI